MTKEHSLYNEIKATEAASLLVRLNGGKMDFAKCIKLLYGIERESIKRWMRPVIFDDLYSLPHGQIVSKTLDLAEDSSQSDESYWSQYLKKEANTIFSIKEAGLGKLSRAEIELIKEIYEANKHKSTVQIFKEHHNPALYPEYKDPQGSRIRTEYPDLLRVLGKTTKQITEFEADLEALASLESLVG
jgi:hypothetical protein